MTQFRRSNPNYKKEVEKKCYLELTIVTFLSLVPILAVITRGLVLTFGLLN